jgi:putative transposase
MSGVGNCYDNAVAESFFGSLKTEMVYRYRWQKRTTIKQAVADYIRFYNARRRHSTLGNKSPIQYEKEYQLALMA